MIIFESILTTFKSNSIFSIAEMIVIKRNIFLHQIKKTARSKIQLRKYEMRVNRSISTADEKKTKKHFYFKGKENYHNNVGNNVNNYFFRK